MTAPTPRMLTEAEAVELIDRLQKSSSRWRPLILAGLLAIIAGFVVLAWTLNARLAKANDLAAMQEKYIDDLNATIGGSRRIVSVNLAGSADDDWHRLANLLQIADERSDALGTSINLPPRAVDVDPVDVSPSPTASATAPDKALIAAEPVTKEIAPKIFRLYIQISAEDQRSSAAAVAALWSGRQIGSATIVVPGIELVRNGGDNTVRCTQPAACASLDAVTRFVNSTLSRPVLAGKDISKRYASAANILPGTYEVWFGPGAIDAAAGD